MVTGNENLQKLGSGGDQVLGVTFDSVLLSKRLWAVLSTIDLLQ